MELSSAKIKTSSGGNFPSSKNRKSYSEKNCYILGNAKF